MLDPDYCSDMDSIVRQFPKNIEYLLIFWKKLSCEKLFLRFYFFQDELYPLLYTFLWVKLVYLHTLENNIHVKALKMQGFSNN